MVILSSGCTIVLLLDICQTMSSIINECISVLHTIRKRLGNKHLGRGDEDKEDIIFLLAAAEVIDACLGLPK